MRISDWSSDVCSSDLRKGAGRRSHRIPGITWRRTRRGDAHRVDRRARPRSTADRPGGRRPSLAGRSEEHTSELQSLMRISYAVFCLKKKNNKLQKQAPGVQNCKTSIKRDECNILKQIYNKQE